MQAAELSPVPPEERGQSPLTLFLIFAGANIVATTLQVGASLASGFDARSALFLILAGSIVGALLVAVLAPLGPRFGAPSVVVARAALGYRGAALVSLLLYVTNFAWIAINNVIAASAAAHVLGGPGSRAAWAFGLGVAATAVVAAGPRAVGMADRVAVPLLLGLGILLTVACLRLPGDLLSRPGGEATPWIRGFDVVVGYQVSWILMFADYSRYTASPRAGFWAVTLALASTSLWLMPLGFAAARAAGSADPGEMMGALGLGAPGGVLLVLATLTTNFVNIYLSSLAWKSLFPGAPDRAVVWSVGLVGSFLSVLPIAWLERYGDFMLILGGLLVPVGGVLLSRFFLVRRPVSVSDLYDPRGPLGRRGGFSLAGLTAWAAGAAVYSITGGIGRTLPALATAAAVEWLLEGRATAGSEGVKVSSGV